MNYLNEQKELNNYLLRIGATKFNQSKVFLLAAYYILTLLWLKIFRFKYKLLKVNDEDVFVSWSPIHYSFLEKLSKIINVNFNNVIIIQRYFSFKQLGMVRNDFSLMDLLVNSYSCSKSVADFLCNIVHLVEFDCLKALLGSNVRNIYISGHFDRFTMTVSHVNKSNNAKLSVCQHGVLSRMRGMPIISVDHVYLQYEISKKYFSYVYDCKSFSVINGLNSDSEKILNGIKIDESTVVFVGQVPRVELNEDIIANIISLGFKVCHIKHPLDSFEYVGFVNYEEVNDFPSNPKYVVSRFSTLAYNYHLLGSTVIFITDEELDVDFFQDSNISMCKLNELGSFLI
jgi:hypothetical protein